MSRFGEAHDTNPMQRSGAGLWATKVRMSESFSRRGGLWVIGQTILMVAIIALGIAFRGQWQSIASWIAGAVLLMVGGYLGIAGVHALGKNRTAFPRPLAEASLVRTGVYGLVRHPLYASVILTTVAWSLLWRSGPALLAAVVMAIFLNAKANREERWLRDKFSEYADYQKRVSRLIPWVW